MKTKPNRPWLTPTGVEIPTGQLKEICKSWDRKTWDAYLKWFERPLRARLLTPVIFQKIWEEQAETIFQSFSQNTSYQTSELCERLLASLPPREAKVLRLIFLEGRTQRQVGGLLNKSQPRIRQLKDSGLLRLRQGVDGEKLLTREFMRGENSEECEVQASFWDQTSPYPIKEAKVYDPKNYRFEFEKIQRSSLRQALKELTQRQQQILYLRFWCDYSFNQIARELKMGFNVAEQISDAALFRLKTKIIEIEAAQTPDGGPQCA